MIYDVVLPKNKTQFLVLCPRYGETSDTIIELLGTGLVRVSRNRFWSKPICPFNLNCLWITTCIRFTRGVLLSFLALLEVLDILGEAEGLFLFNTNSTRKIDFLKAPERRLTLRWNTWPGRISWRNVGFQFSLPAPTTFGICSITYLGIKRWTPKDCLKTCSSKSVVRFWV